LCFALERAASPGSRLAPFLPPGTSLALSALNRLDFSSEADRRIVGEIAEHLPSTFEAELQQLLAKPGETGAEQALLERFEAARRKAAVGLAVRLKAEADDVLNRASKLEVSELWSAYRALEKYAAVGPETAGVLGGVRRAAFAARDDRQMAVARAIAKELLGSVLSDREGARPVETKDLAVDGYWRFLREDPALAGMFLRPRGSDEPPFRTLSSFRAFYAGEKVTLPGVLLAAYFSAAQIAEERDIVADEQWISVMVKDSKGSWDKYISFSQREMDRVEPDGSLLFWSRDVLAPFRLRQYGIDAAKRTESVEGWYVNRVRPVAVQPTLGQTEELFAPGLLSFIHDDTKYGRAFSLELPASDGKPRPGQMVLGQDGFPVYRILRDFEGFAPGEPIGLAGLALAAYNALPSKHGERHIIVLKDWIELVGRERPESGMRRLASISRKEPGTLWIEWPGLVERLEALGVVLRHVRRHERWQVYSVAPEAGRR
jgi:hypothetical protein